MIKRIIIADSDRDGFELFCEKYDIPVMDRAYLATVFETDGWDEALDTWRELRSENYAVY